MARDGIGTSEQFVVPPEASAALVAAMEDELDGYRRPRDPGRPVVCLDEASEQLGFATPRLNPAGHALRLKALLQSSRFCVLHRQKIEKTQCVIDYDVGSK